MIELYPTGLSHDAELVLTAICAALHGRTPTPALLNDIAPLYRDVVPDHIAIIKTLPKTPGGRRRATSRYELSIKGPRIQATWTLTNGWLIRHFQKLQQLSGLV